MSDEHHTTDPDSSQRQKISKRLEYGPRRKKYGEGKYVAPRSDLKPGAITRREWLRFMSYVEEGNTCLCTPEIPHRHWVWIGVRTREGYGRFSWRGRNYLAHRFAYIALRSVIIDGLEPDHLCRMTCCCNPDCIDIVSPQVNKLRGKGIAAMCARKTHCLKGHLLEGQNLRACKLKKGWRACRICFNESHRIAKHHKKQAKEGLSTF
jgi:hypothetical protein